METKHTKGEWRIENGCIVASQSKEDWTFICEINKDMLNSKKYAPELEVEAKANLKLIAAAPELLEALNLICEYEERGRANGKPRISEKWYNTANDAIKKATL